MDGLTGVLLVVVAVGLLMLFSAGRSREQARLHRRLAAVERKLDLVVRHLEIAEPEEHSPAVVELLRQGNKIGAIKLYREETGASLLEAKQEIEDLTRRRGL